MKIADTNFNLNDKILPVHKGPYIYDIQKMGQGGQIKNGQNSDKSGWLQGGGSTEIGCPQL